MIVKTVAYDRDQVAKVVQLRANVEGLKLSSGVLEKLAAEGEKSSLRSEFYFQHILLLYSLHHSQICASVTHPRIDPCDISWQISN